MKNPNNHGEFKFALVTKLEDSTIQIGRYENSILIRIERDKTEFDVPEKTTCKCTMDDKKILTEISFSTEAMKHLQKLFTAVESYDNLI